MRVQLSTYSCAVHDENDLAPTCFYILLRTVDYRCSKLQFNGMYSTQPVKIFWTLWEQRMVCYTGVSIIWRLFYMHNNLCGPIKIAFYRDFHYIVCYKLKAFLCIECCYFYASLPYVYKAREDTKMADCQTSSFVYYWNERL